jgi:hypothetical protein
MGANISQALTVFHDHAKIRTSSIFSTQDFNFHAIDLPNTSVQGKLNGVPAPQILDFWASVSIKLSTVLL